MQERHTNRKQYFEEQEYTTGKYVIPFISSCFPVNSDINVLEIGCGEGGNIKPFLDMGCKVTGIDISENKIALAKQFYEKQPDSHLLTLIAKDIYNIDDSYKNKFDLIIMRDVLEHIHNHNRFMNLLKTLIKPEGKIFIGFPAWQNPFGGHQQMCESKILSNMPYFHLFPKPVYKFILRLFGETKGKIDGLIEIRNTRITIEKFEKLSKKEAFNILKKILYFISPNYEIKFNIKHKKLNKILASIPVIRNYFTTTCFYLISE